MLLEQQATELISEKTVYQRHARGQGEQFEHANKHVSWIGRKPSSPEPPTSSGRWEQFPSLLMSRAFYMKQWGNGISVRVVQLRQHV